MSKKFLSLLCRALLGISLGISLPIVAVAQTVTVPADARGANDIGRFKPEERLRPIVRQDERVFSIPSGISRTAVPDGAKDIHFVLKDISIEGATAFSASQLAEIYQLWLGQKISLDIVYSIASKITEKYREAGYFLALAYLPDQQVTDGVMTIRVLEGYIDEVELPKPLQTLDVVQSYTQRLKAQRPISAQALESYLLRLDDLPGYSVTGTLSSLNNATDGAIKLSLDIADKTGKGQIGFDNSLSRFLGPYEGTISYSKSFHPLQNTSVATILSAPHTRLSAVTLNHDMLIAPDVTLNLTSSFVKSKPGFTLEPYKIQGNSIFLSAGMTYQWIRQRRENLSLKVAIDSRNTDSDLLDMPFTRDRIRALRMSVNYDYMDSWGGFNNFSGKLSLGLDGLGSSQQGGANLSRAEARPDFRKIELSLSRLQDLGGKTSLLMTGAGQVSNASLYSAEQFGYGGQNFGRAFDSSELIGDNGVTGSVEMRFDGWSHLQPFGISPYAFYDIGVVWNDGQTNKRSGASAGFGMRTSSRFGLYGNIALAWPLTREIATPIYGDKKSDPRLLLQIYKDF